jgi:hypothetical protein
MGFPAARPYNRSEPLSLLNGLTAGAYRKKGAETKGRFIFMRFSGFASSDPPVSRG